MRDEKKINEDYLDYIRQQPSLVSTKDSQGPVDPDHLIARGTNEHKRNDYTAVPLDRHHHTVRGNKGIDTFNKAYGINLWQEAHRLTVAYFEHKLLEARNVLETAAQVRKVQVEYFKTKDRDALIEAKRLEAALDMRLATIGIRAK